MMALFRIHHQFPLEAPQSSKRTALCKFSYAALDTKGITAFGKVQQPNAFSMTYVAAVYNEPFIYNESKNFRSRPNP